MTFGRAMQATTIGEKYRLVRELGNGGMGTVYEAQHLATRRRVALKLMRSDVLEHEHGPQRLRRFEREVLAAGSIDSQHVVQVTDAGFDQASQRPYLVMEYLSGEDLRQLLRRSRALPSDLVLRIAAQVCLGLAGAHENGVIHRDIKSANVFLSKSDNGRVVVKVLDFGIAKTRVQPFGSKDVHDLTRSGAVIGSPAYMSPEQALGSRTLDPRADLWSLGVVMYEALSGSTPHGRDLALGALIVAICSTPCASLRERAPWVSEEVAAIVHRALALEPSQRFGSAREMYAAIRALVPDEAIREEMLVPEPLASGLRTATEPERAPTGIDETARLSEFDVLPGQTTAEAFTLGGRAASGLRWRARPLGVLGLLSGITAGLLVWGANSRPEPSNPALDSPSSQASVVAARTAPSALPSAAPKALTEVILDAPTPAASPNPNPRKKPSARPSKKPASESAVDASPPSTKTGAAATSTTPTIDREF